MPRLHAPDLPTAPDHPAAVAPADLIDSVPESLIATDLDGRITLWNRAAAELFGYQASEVMGRMITDVITPVTMRRDAVEIARSLGRDELRFGAELMRGANGVEIAVHYRAAPVRDVSGRIVGTVAVSRRASDSGEAERLLRRNAEMHQLLFQTSPTPKWIIDRESLQFLDVNDAAVALYGYSHADFTSMTLDQVHRDAPVETLRGYLTQPVGGETRHTQMKHRTRDGRELDVQISRRDIEYAGRHARLASMIDFTEQHAAERELRRSEALFRTLSENAFEIMAIFSPDGRFTMTSSARALGYAPREVLGKTIADLLHPDDLEAVQRLVAEVAAVPGARQRIETRCRHHDGGWRTLEGELVNLCDHPAIGGIVANCRDITEQRRAQEALRESEVRLQQAQKMEAIGQLAGGVAHDFNNLLTVIRSYSELARLGLSPDHELQQELGEVLRAVDRAAILTRQLLAYSRRQLLQPRRLCVMEVVRGVERMLRRTLGEHIQLDVAIEPETPQVIVDESQLEQVVLNLVINARDAMPDGGTLTVSVSPALLDDADVVNLGGSVGGEFARIAVIDSGCGMAPDVLERIFEPFFTTKAMGDGTGLGLSTVYGIVKQSGGYVDVHSELGSGTRFDVYLPAAHGPDPERIQSSVPAPASDDRGNESILLVEDSAAVRMIARRALQSAGYRVLDASDGVEALELARSVTERIDLVVTDLVMPRMNGINLVEQLRADGFAGAALVMTGYSDNLLSAGALDPATMPACVEKPFTMSTLVARVRAVLDERATHTLDAST